MGDVGQPAHAMDGTCEQLLFNLSNALAAVDHWSAKYSATQDPHAWYMLGKAYEWEHEALMDYTFHCQG